MKRHGEEVMNHKALTYLSSGSCMYIAVRRNMQAQRNRGGGWVGSVCGGGFCHSHSLLKTLPQITWEKNLKLSLRVLRQSLDFAYSWCPACSVPDCRWERCGFLNMFYLFWCWWPVHQVNLIGRGQSSAQSSFWFLFGSAEQLDENNFDCFQKPVFTSL